MVSSTKLDAFGCPRAAQLIALTVLLLASWQTPGQELHSDNARISAAQTAMDAGKWEEAAKLAQGPRSQPAELDFLAGMALARLQRWSESRAAFETGHHKSPNDSRFLVEMAGADYKLHNFSAAKRELRRSLHRGAGDAYTREFLASIYFLEGNLEAALKYWNLVDKPRLRSVTVQPQPRTGEELLRRAIGFNAPQVLTQEALLNAEARLDNLGTFPQERLELAPASGENYDANLHLAERNGWGDSKVQAAVTLLRGLPYATIYPEFYNMGGRAVNLSSLARWDSEKRRAFVSLSTPVRSNPAMRLRVYLDARNENWNLTDTFFGGGLPLNDLNLRRIAGGAEFRDVVNGRWSWTTGVEVANRSFRNLQGHTSAAEVPFFTGGTSFGSWLRSEASIVRVPERRFTLQASAEARVGRNFSDTLGAFGTIGGSLQARWFPRAMSDDYEINAQVRSAATAGRVPFDELFQLGIERDNDLWLRGHAGTFHGRKGAAPLGRRYLLTNWEMNKNIYSNGFFTIKLGPFVDNGAIADASRLFGSQQWLWDAGVQCKIRVLGGVTVALSYGRGLRDGRNVFYGTALH
jgi:tetratricopeptide (TPR) repeat protein